MKRTSIIIAAILTLLLAGHAFADLMYYTFEGTLTSITMDNAEAVLNAELIVTDPVSYTFAVDFEAVGFIKYYNGTYITQADIPNHLDYFYTYLVGEGYLSSVNGGYTPENYVQEYNKGNYSGFTGTSHLLGDSQGDFVIIFGSAHLSDWLEDQTGLWGWERAMNNR